jgi:hypothetical protein
MSARRSPFAREGAMRCAYCALRPNFRRKIRTGCSGADRGAGFGAHRPRQTRCVPCRADQSQTIGSPASITSPCRPTPPSAPRRLPRTGLRVANGPTSGELSCPPLFLCLRQSRPHPRQFLWRHRLRIGISLRSCVNFFIGHCHDLRPIRFIVRRKVIAAVAHDFGCTVLAHVVRPYGQL